MPSAEAAAPDLKVPVDGDDEYLHGNQRGLVTHSWYVPGNRD